MEDASKKQKILIDWDFPEFSKYERGKKWYLLVIILVTLFLLYAIWTKNILFAIILVLAAFIGVVQHFQKPVMVDAAITEDGVVIGNKFYAYEDLEKFWIIYKPEIAKLLYLDFKNPLKRRLAIPLEEVDPLKVRSILQQYLEEDLEREEEELGDSLAKVLKM